MLTQLSVQKYSSIVGWRVSSLLNIVETFMESATAANLSLEIDTNFVGGTLEQYTIMGSNNNDILDGLSIVDEYVQIAMNKLHLLK